LVFIGQNDSGAKKIWTISETDSISTLDLADIAGFPSVNTTLSQDLLILSALKSSGLQAVWSFDGTSLVELIEFPNSFSSPFPVLLNNDVIYFAFRSNSWSSA